MHSCSDPVNTEIKNMSEKSALLLSALVSLIVVLLTSKFESSTWGNLFILFIGTFLISNGTVYFGVYAIGKMAFKNAMEILKAEEKNSLLLFKKRQQNSHLPRLFSLPPTSPSYNHARKGQGQYPYIGY